jgi:tRNA(fMet)-specific endonuclease VapC
LTQLPIREDRIIADTDVVSYVFGEREEAKFFLPYFSGKTIAISFITVAQVYFGAFKNNWSDTKVGKLERHLKNYLILPYDIGVCIMWAEIAAHCDNSGYHIETADCWIAACALHYGCRLATNNRKHFEHVDGLRLITPGLV